MCNAASFYSSDLVFLWHHIVGYTNDPSILPKPMMRNRCVAGQGIAERKVKIIVYRRWDLLEVNKRKEVDSL